MKSFTDIEQSKKLAEILPIESADMCHNINKMYKQMPPLMTPYSRFKEFYDMEPTPDFLIPCWSLAALLDYLKSKNKFPEIKELSDGRFKLTTYIWDGKDCIQFSIGDTIVDACCEMIIKLKEKNLL